jgi:hypothetical protein
MLASKKKFLKFFSLIILFLSNVVIRTDFIIPDGQNPIQYNPTRSNANSNTLTLKFSFPSTSPGLNYGQFLCVSFPPEYASDFKFDTGGFTCGLSDNNSKTYTVSAVASAASPITSTIPVEGNIAHCRLDDLTNTPLKTGQSTTYTLTFSFTTKKTSDNFIRTVGLFTATTNNPERIIIDSNPVMGSLVQYGDWTSPSLIQPIEISSATRTVTTGPTGNAVYPYNIFDISFTVKVNQWITSIDHTFLFQFPNDLTSAATSVISTSINSETLGSALKGTLTLSTFATNLMQLNGISEDLVPGRQFILTLKSFKALDSINSTTARLLELYVYYKNTYSVLSYSNVGIFLVNQSTIQMTANHPEYWDIWRNAAWPIKFSFTPNVDLTPSSGVYVTIQHTSAVDGNSITAQKFSFIASTCDFSDNPDIDNSFGKRPPCFPMRTDFTYPNMTGTYKGSGIFFNLKSGILSSKKYYVTVWGYADNCAGSSFGFNLTGGISPKVNSQNITFSFTATVYKGISGTAQNESRFSSTSAISASLNTAMSGVCWNNIIQGGSTENQWDKNFLTNTKSDISLTPSNSDFILYKEFHHNWMLISNTNANCLTGTGCYPKDITNPDDKIPMYIYSSPLLLGSYFVVSLQIIRTSTDVFMSYFPTNYYNFLAGSPNSASSYSGRLVAQFSSAWFSKSSKYLLSSTGSSCWLSWGLQNDLITTNNSQYDLQNKSQANSITPQNNLDISNSYLGTTPTSSISTIFKISSNYLTTQKYFIDAMKSNSGGTSTSLFNAAFYSTCLQFVSQLPTIKTIYSYIDIQFRFEYMNTSSSIAYPIRNARFIKLFPEGGVFHDPNTKGNMPSSINPFHNHYGYGLSSQQNSVCLLEIYGPALVSTTNKTANTLVLNLFFGTLLEVDYSNVSSQYPVTGLPPGITVYGIQAAMPMSTSQTAGSGNALLDSINSSTSLISTMKQTRNTSSSISNSLSAYHFYFGSTLFFTGIVSNSITPINQNKLAGNISIPYYCPIGTNTNDNYASTIFPIVTGNWMNMSSYSIIRSMNKLINWKDTLNSNAIYTVIIPNTSNMNTAKVSAVGVAPKNAVLRWASYATTTDTILYVYNISSAAVKCSVYMIFLASSISFDTSLTYSSTLTSVTTNSVSLSFYVFGKNFTKTAILGNINPNGSLASSTSLPVTALSVESSSVYFTGVKRPSVDTLGTLGAHDKVAFFCSSPVSSESDMLTNFIYSGPTGSVISQFVVDFNPIKTAWTAPSLMFDKNEVFKLDVSGNIRITLNPPTTIPSGITIPTGASLVFSSNNFDPTKTICGIINTTTNTNTDCTINSTTVSCKIPLPSIIMTVCCYNVNITDSISLTSLGVVFPLSSAALGTVLTNTQIYTQTTLTASLTTGQASASDIINLKKASLKIRYTHVNQEAGIGKARIYLKLPREITRDTQYVISGDFSSLLIPNLIPRCFIHVSNVINQNTINVSGADLFIETCSVKNILSNINPITVTTKRFTYKCGLKFGSQLIISLWPIRQNIIIIQGNFSLNAILSSTKEALIQSNNFLKMNFNEEGFLKKSDLDPLWNTLCQLNIALRLPGETSDYTFIFDISQMSDITQVNEFSIFWPYNHYPFFITNFPVFCLSDNVFISCSFSEAGLLNIYFPQGPQNSKSVNITIKGVMNPSIPKASDIYFACSINNYNQLTKVRRNLITGSGKFSGGIVRPTSIIFGNLRFRAVSSSDLNPRNNSIYMFRIGFDTANGLTTIPSLLDNTPIFNINFPFMNYIFMYYNELGNLRLNIAATIDEYTSDTSRMVISKSDTFQPVVTISGNQITLTWPSISYSVPSNFKYFEIKLFNVRNPDDNTSPTGQGTALSSLFSISLTNSIQSIFYKTFTNVISVANEQVTANSYLGFNRGLNFSFDNNLWVVDIADSKTPAILNQLTINAGRYLQTNIIVRSNNVPSSISANAFLSLDNEGNKRYSSIFQLQTDKYFISSHLGQTITMYIGAPCGCTVGNYIVYFSLTQTDVVSPNGKFAPLLPLLVILESSRGIINTSNVNFFAAGGSTVIQITLSEPNVDPISITWKIQDKVDPSTTLTPVLIPAGTLFSTTLTTPVIPYPTFSYFYSPGSTKNTPLQIFQGISSNSCYYFKQSLVKFSILGNTSDVPSSFFSGIYGVTFVNNDSALPKNAFKFTFSKKLPLPVYVYAVLICNPYLPYILTTANTTPPLSTSLFPIPSDSDIKQRITPASNPTRNVFQYFFNIFTSNSQSTDIIFTNLHRNRQYMVKIIVESTHGDPSLRTSASLTLTAWDLLFNNYYSTLAMQNATFVHGLQMIGVRSSIAYSNVFYSNSFFNPTLTVVTQCLQFQISSDPGPAAKRTLINYCQFLFSTTGSLGFFSNGCIICSDFPTTYNSFGPTKLIIDSGCVTKAINKLRFLDTSFPLGPYQNLKVLPNTFTLCAAPQPSCTGDVSAGGKTYADMINLLKTNLISGEKIQSLLGINGLKIDSIVTIIDSSEPLLTRSMVSNVSYEQETGTVSWWNSFSSPIYCYFLIKKTTITPSLDEMKSCSDPNFCGLISINNTPTKYSVTPYPAFENGYYNVFYMCYNYVINSQKSSAVFNSFNFIIKPK